MYGKEDRERILADLRASGLTVASFARLPGSPSRQSLSSWRRQAEAGLLDVPERKVRGRCEHGRHGRYPEATKREAVSLRRKGMGFADIARRLGVSSGSVVASWWRKAGEGGTMAPKEAVPMDPGRKAAGATREELEAMLAEAQMENAVLRELMRDPKAGDPASLSNRRKAELGERLRRDCGYSLKEITAFLRMPKSTYEYNRRRNAGRAARDEAVAARVREAFEASGRRYGYRRTRAAMASGSDGGEPFAASEREVRRAMREGGMTARRTRRGSRYSSYAGEVDGRPANLPLREDGTHDFGASRPGELVVTDVTEFKAGGRKVYLSPIIDCFDGMPVSWSVSERPDSALCDSSLLSFLSTLPEGHPPVTAHSDGGLATPSWTLYSESQPRQSELDRAHVAERRVEPEVVVPVDVIAQLRLKLAQRREPLPVDELGFEYLVGGLVHGVVVWAPLRRQRALYLEDVQKLVDGRVVELRAPVRMKDLYVVQREAQRGERGLHQPGVLALSGSVPDDLAVVQVD